MRFSMASSDPSTTPELVSTCNRLPSTQITHIVFLRHSIARETDVILALESSSCARASSSLLDDGSSVGQRMSIDAARAGVAARATPRARHQRRHMVLEFSHDRARKQTIVAPSLVIKKGAILKLGNGN